MLLLFREVSLISLGANLIAIPWVTLCVTPLALLGVLWSPAWHWAAIALEGLQGACRLGRCRLFPCGWR